ncbi:hypothetical protein DFH11DRAFT_1545176 [Phellopilus nigrolimitatus]|nr:hypothetical protein DFH11DRAFT_1545176 [Phellopilus nigrolimitatus]
MPCTYITYVAHGAILSQPDTLPSARRSADAEHRSTAAREGRTEDTAQSRSAVAPHHKEKKKHGGGGWDQEGDRGGREASALGRQTGASAQHRREARSATYAPAGAGGELGHINYQTPNQVSSKAVSHARHSPALFALVVQNPEPEPEGQKEPPPPANLNIAGHGGGQRSTTRRAAMGGRRRRRTRRSGAGAREPRRQAPGPCARRSPAKGAHGDAEARGKGRAGQGAGKGREGGEGKSAARAARAAGSSPVPRLASQLPRRTRRAGEGGTEAEAHTSERATPRFSRSAIHARSHRRAKPYMHAQPVGAQRQARGKGKDPEAAERAKQNAFPRQNTPKACNHKQEMCDYKTRFGDATRPRIVCICGVPYHTGATESVCPGICAGARRRGRFAAHLVVVVVVVVASERSTEDDRPEESLELGLRPWLGLGRGTAHSDCPAARARTRRGRAVPSRVLGPRPRPAQEAMGDGRWAMEEGLGSATTQMQTKTGRHWSACAQIAEKGTRRGEHAPSTGKDGGRGSEGLRSEKGKRTRRGTDVDVDVDAHTRTHENDEAEPEPKPRYMQGRRARSEACSPTHTRTIDAIDTHDVYPALSIGTPRAFEAVRNRFLMYGSRSSFSVLEPSSSTSSARRVCPYPRHTRTRDDEARGASGLRGLEARQQALGFRVPGSALRLRLRMYTRMRVGAARLRAPLLPHTYKCQTVSEEAGGAPAMTQAEAAVHVRPQQRALSGSGPGRTTQAQARIDAGTACAFRLRPGAVPWTVWSDRVRGREARDDDGAGRQGIQKRRGAGASTPVDSTHVVQNTNYQKQPLTQAQPDRSLPGAIWDLRPTSICMNLRRESNCISSPRSRAGRQGPLEMNARSHSNIPAKRSRPPPVRALGRRSAIRGGHAARAGGRRTEKAGGLPGRGLAALEGRRGAAPEKERERGREKEALGRASWAAGWRGARGLPERATEARSPRGGIYVAGLGASARREAGAATATATACERGERMWM